MHVSGMELLRSHRFVGRPQGDVTFKASCMAKAGYHSAEQLQRIRLVSIPRHAASHVLVVPYLLQLLQLSLAFGIHSAAVISQCLLICTERYPDL